MREQGLWSRNVQGQIPVWSLTSSSITAKQLEPCFRFLLLKMRKESNSIYLIGVLWKISELKYARPLEQYVAYECFRGVGCCYCSIEENCSSERLETNYAIGFLVFSSRDKQNTGVLFYFNLHKELHWLSGKFWKVFVCF